jgi:ribosomal protein L18
VQKSKVDRFKTASEIKAEMQNEHAVHISVSTTRRRPREAGLNGRKPRKKLRLTFRHNKVRLQFARTDRNWTAQQWSEVILSEEWLARISKNIVSNLH